MGTEQFLYYTVTEAPLQPKLSQHAAGHDLVVRVDADGVGHIIKSRQFRPEAPKRSLTARLRKAVSA